MKSNQLVTILKPYFEREKDILFGFLFGSSASGNTCLESDIDIAIYLREENNGLESKIQDDLDKLLKKEVDLVILNRTPSTLAWNILRKGISIGIKDRGVYLDFMLEVSGEAEDLIDFNLDAWRMKYAFGAG